MVEVYDDNIDEVMKYYGSPYSDELAHFPFNFYLITDFPSRQHLSGISLKITIDIWMDNMPDGKWPNWVVR